MKRIAIIGYPLGHSLSPAFQQAALDHLGLDARYEAWETPTEGLTRIVDALRSPDCLGANVTVPHKEAVMPLLDETDELARQIGAVNTIVSRDGHLSGHNTDAIGFSRTLREDAGFDASGCRALVLGAGGAARAVIIALAQDGAASVTVINRTLSRATELIEDLQPHLGRTSLHTLPEAYASLAASLPGCRLLVNCTPVGMAGVREERGSPLPSELIPSGILVFDLVYNPPQTKLLAAAKKRGARTLGGLPMLVYQGAASFELWSGRPAPLEVMLQAARRALGPAGPPGRPTSGPVGRGG
ncbi:MAG: shikimate dehydrogenase [Dehalococcoidia bacterium]